MNKPHFKSFEIDGHHVLIMLRGAGDNDDTIKIEQSVHTQGLFVSATIQAPAEGTDEVFDNIGEDAARKFLAAVKSMLNP